MHLLEVNVMSCGFCALKIVLKNVAWLDVLNECFHVEGEGRDVRDEQEETCSCEKVVTVFVP